MSNSIKNNSLIEDFRQESTDMLATLEKDIISLKDNPEIINNVFRTAHTIKGNAGILGFSNIGQLSHCMENLLDLLRSEKIQADDTVIELLLEGADLLQLLFVSLEDSNDIDITQIKVQFDTFSTKNSPTPPQQEKITPKPSAKEDKAPASNNDPIKILIVEDELTSRLVLSKILSEYGTVDVAVDGEEAVQAYTIALHDQKPYDFITLDIKLPKMDGHEVLAIIRHLEDEHRKPGDKIAKIVMTTASDNKSDI